MEGDDGDLFLELGGRYAGEFNDGVYFENRIGTGIRRRISHETEGNAVGNLSLQPRSVYRDAKRKSEFVVVERNARNEIGLIHSLGTGHLLQAARQIVPEGDAWKKILSSEPLEVSQLLEERLFVLVEVDI
jgi:hypothetical protein